MHDRFVAAIKTFAADHAVPLIEFESGQDKDAIVATHRARFRGTDGVVVLCENLADAHPSIIRGSTPSEDGLALGTPPV